MPTGIGDNIRPVRDHYDKLFDLLDRGKLINWTGSAAVADRLQDQRIADGRKCRLPWLPVVGWRTSAEKGNAHTTGQPGVSTILRVLPVLIYGVAQTAIQERIGTVR